MRKRKIVFIIPPTVELLDLAGPVQVFVEARFYGFDIDIEFYIYSKNVISTSGLTFGKLRDYSKARLKQGDYVFIPGMDHRYINSPKFKAEKKFFRWIKSNAEKKVFICSVCNGAFVLGNAGLLKNRRCTTHWRRVSQLQQEFPTANVVDDVLFVKTDNIYSSGGISAGIDLALDVITDLKGPQFTQVITRGLVIYHRTTPLQGERSVFLEYRNHINPEVHTIQDYLTENPSRKISHEKLASMVSMSPHNLAILFKEVTGVTIKKYVTQLRQEHAKQPCDDN